MIIFNKPLAKKGSCLTLAECKSPGERLFFFSLEKSDYGIKETPASTCRKVGRVSVALLESVFNTFSLTATDNQPLEGWRQGVSLHKKMFKTRSVPLGRRSKYCTHKSILSQHMLFIEKQNTTWVPYAVVERSSFDAYERIYYVHSR